MKRLNFCTFVHCVTVSLNLTNMRPDYDAKWSYEDNLVIKCCNLTTRFL